VTDPQSGPAAPEPRPTSGPAPRWGEYAPLPPAPPVQPSAQPTPVVPMAPRAPGGAPVRRRRTWDLVLTIALLAYGLMTVLASLSGASDLGRTIEQVYVLQGLGDYTPTALAGTLTTVANVAQVVLLGLAAYLSYRLLKAGRIAFWVPLVAGAIASLLVGVFGLTLMVSDPSFQDYIRSVG
jgi:Family of unknown function (DUF6264)